MGKRRNLLFETFALSSFIVVLSSSIVISSLALAIPVVKDPGEKKLKEFSGVGNEFVAEWSYSGEFLMEDESEEEDSTVKPKTTSTTEETNFLFLNEETFPSNRISPGRWRDSGGNWWLFGGQKPTFPSISSSKEASNSNSTYYPNSKSQSQDFFSDLWLYSPSQEEEREGNSFGDKSKQWRLIFKPDSTSPNPMSSYPENLKNPLLCGSSRFGHVALFAGTIHKEKEKKKGSFSNGKSLTEDNIVWLFDVPKTVANDKESESGKSKKEDRLNQLKESLWTSYICCDTCLPPDSSMNSSMLEFCPKFYGDPLFWCGEDSLMSLQLNERELLWWEFSLQSTEWIKKPNLELDEKAFGYLKRGNCRTVTSGLELFVYIFCPSAEENANSGKILGSKTDQALLIFDMKRNRIDIHSHIMLNIAFVDEEVWAPENSVFNAVSIPEKNLTLIFLGYQRLLDIWIHNHSSNTLNAVENLWKGSTLRVFQRYFSFYKLTVSLIDSPIVEKEKLETLYMVNPRGSVQSFQDKSPKLSFHINIMRDQNTFLPSRDASFLIDPMGNLEQEETSRNKSNIEQKSQKNNNNNNNNNDTTSSITLIKTFENRASVSAQQKSKNGNGKNGDSNIQELHTYTSHASDENENENDNEIRQFALPHSRPAGVGEKEKQKTIFSLMRNATKMTKAGNQNLATSVPPLLFTNRSSNASVPNTNTNTEAPLPQRKVINSQNTISPPPILLLPQNVSAASSSSLTTQVILESESSRGEEGEEEKNESESGQQIQQSLNGKSESSPISQREDKNNGMNGKMQSKSNQNLGSNESAERAPDLDHSSAPKYNSFSSSLPQIPEKNWTRIKINSSLSASGERRKEIISLTTTTTTDASIKSSTISTIPTTIVTSKNKEIRTPQGRIIDRMKTIPQRKQFEVENKKGKSFASIIDPLSSPIIITRNSGGAQVSLSNNNNNASIYNSKSALLSHSKDSSSSDRSKTLIKDVKNIEVPPPTHVPNLSTTSSFGTIKYFKEDRDDHHDDDNFNNEEADVDEERIEFSSKFEEPTPIPLQQKPTTVNHRFTDRNSIGIIPNNNNNNNHDNKSSNSNTAAKENHEDGLRVKESSLSNRVQHNNYNLSPSTAWNSSNNFYPGIPKDNNSKSNSWINPIQNQYEQVTSQSYIKVGREIMPKESSSRGDVYPSYIGYSPISNNNNNNNEKNYDHNPFTYSSSGTGYNSHPFGPNFSISPSSSSNGGILSSSISSTESTASSMLFFAISLGIFATIGVAVFIRKCVKCPPRQNVLIKEPPPIRYSVIPDELSYNYNHTPII